MKHVFIVNPIAGGKDRTGEIMQKVQSAAIRHAGDDFEVYITKAPMDAAVEIKKRASSGEEIRFYSCGGDGTFSECCTGALGFDNAAVAPFPTGTGNDFCRMFGKEKDMFRDIDALVEGSVHPIDLINCSGRYSANICSVGFDARVGCNVHKYSKIPFFAGAAGYVLSFFAELFKGLNQHMKIRCGDTVLEDDFALVCVCNGRYYGGGFNPSLSAMPDDGDLDIYIAKNMHIFRLAANLVKYASGKSDDIPQHIIHLHGTEIKIEFESDTIINIDGEAFVSPAADIKLERSAVNLIVPKEMKFFEKA